MPRNLLRDPWWKRILAGDTTAVPYEWIAEDGSLELAGEEAEEFIDILKENNVELTPEMAKACAEYTTREVINTTGKHPYGMDSKEWEEMYGETK